MRTTLDVSGHLGRDGFQDCSVQLDSTNGRDVVEVSFSGHRTLRGERALDRAAEIVWDELPLSFDEIVVRVRGEGYSFERRDLEAAFGPRDPALDQRRVGQEIAGSFAAIGSIVLIVVVVGMGLLVWLVVWLVRRDQRRRPPPGPYRPFRYPPGPPQR